MYFRFLIDDTTGCVSYLLADDSQGVAVLIDPRLADLAVINGMLDEKKLALKWVLRTHSHPTEKPLGPDSLQLPSACFVGAGPLGSVPSNLTFGSEQLQLIATPGHTCACLSYLWRDRLFCGGLLAADACPYQPRPECPASLWDSANRKVFTLPNETLLFGGHSRGGRVVSTVMEQRSTHPWFAGASRDDFLSRFTPVSGVQHHPTHSICQEFRTEKSPHETN